MPVDHTYPLRKAILTYLKANAGVSALVADRIYPMKAPAGVKWPFIRYGAPLARGFEATGYDGSEHRITLHCFAHGETDTALLCAAVQEALKNNELPLEPRKLISMRWITTQILVDDADNDQFHGLMKYEVMTSE